MKRNIIILVITVGLIIVISVIAFLVYLYKFNENINQGKTFVITINEDEEIDHNAVNQDRFTDFMGSQINAPWFNLIDDTEREKLVSFMKENNYRIVAGQYELRYGSKFDDICQVLEFVEIS